MVLAAACSNRRSQPAGIGPPPGDPKLRFVVGPTSARAGVPLAAMRVEAVDGFGEPATTEIQLELEAPAQGALLVGTLTAATVAGVATFADVAIDRGGSYRLRAVAPGFLPAVSDEVEVQPAPLHLVLMIADGWGYKQVEAERSYTGRDPIYARFDSFGMATYDLSTAKAHQGVGYDPVRAWTSLTYPMAAATDSAAAATSMYTGEKTYNGHIGVGVGGRRLLSLAEAAQAQGLAIGAVTSVPVSHATPAAWLAHNVSRGNYYALADEMLWRDPATTGNVALDPRYEGSLGTSAVTAAVLLGGGHPGWVGETYLRMAMRDKLAAESSRPGAWHFVERVVGQPDGGARLLAAAASGVERLCGLFGGAGGNLEFRRADGSGQSPENPTLAEMTTAALRVLQSRPAGFALMVEGGAIDYAGHGNDLDASIGEMIDFEDAVRVVVEWVETPGDAIDWHNTLLIVTGDHETGYLAAGATAFADVPLGEVSPRTLALEKTVLSTGQRASWEDLDHNQEIDLGESVYWVWHTSGHSNSLIPLHAHGREASRFAAKVVATDPVRGAYVDNTAVFQVMSEVLSAPR